MEKSEFYTLKGYKLKQNNEITEAMEDYLEMIYRLTKEKKETRIKEIAYELNVSKSSASKMVSKLKMYNYVNFKKYGNIVLTIKGIKRGSFLLWRHNTLVEFFKFLNKKNYNLEQVEKVEHFVDIVTLKNMEKLIKLQK